MRKVLVVFGIIVLALVVGLWWLLADANRFKPQLVALIHDKSGLAVDVRGDLSWRWWPPVQLVAHDLTANWAADAAAPMLSVRTLRFDADALALLSRNPKLVIQGVAVDGLHAQLTQRGEHANWMPPEEPGVAPATVVPPVPIPLPMQSAPAPWEVASVAVSDAVIDYVVDDDATQIRIDALHASDIAPTREFPLHAKLTIERIDGETPLTIAAKLRFDELVAEWQIDAIDIAGRIDGAPFQLKGNARMNTAAGTPDAMKVRVDFDLAIDRLDVTSDATAVATLGGGSFGLIAFAAPPIALDPSLDEPLLPLDLIGYVDWSGELAIGQLLYDGATFDDATIHSTGVDGRIEATINLPKFFGGNATTQMTIDATANPLKWKLAPKLEQVDSKALLALLDQDYDWVASFLAAGELDMRGNSERELIGSLTGHLSFDGGEGTIGIQAIKNASLAIAHVIGGTDRVDAWPDRLAYKHFAGGWDAHGKDHAFDVVLDNLSIKGDGQVDALADTMDLRVTVTAEAASPHPSFDVGKTLTGLPLPMRCTGSIARPQCGADADATKRLIARALTGSDPELTKRIDRAVDEQVPEEYRDTARSLLDLLRSGGNQPPPK
jgi:uncharacterized protein involved in outer membrane biogenesis